MWNRTVDKVTSNNPILLALMVLLLASISPPPKSIKASGARTPTVSESERSKDYKLTQLYMSYTVHIF